MRIVLDAMGSDTHPEPELQAAVEASTRFGEEIILVGPADLLEPRLRALCGDKACVHLVHAPEVLEMTDKPAQNARRKAQNSMASAWTCSKTAKPTPSSPPATPAARWPPVCFAWVASEGSSGLP
jgi:phosphate acyltransferase